MMNVRLIALLFFVGAGLCPSLLRADSAAPLELAGIAVIPHSQASGMRYRRDPDPGLGARVQLFVRNASSAELRLPALLGTRFRGLQPTELVESNAWCWFDTPAAWPDSELILPAGALTVWQFNSRDATWGLGTDFNLEVQFDEQRRQQFDKLQIVGPQAWISAVTCLSTKGEVRPDQVVIHVANHSKSAIRLEACRLWLPADQATWRALSPQSIVPIKAFPQGGLVAAGQKGGVVLNLGPLPLTYAAIELQCSEESGTKLSLWGHLRIKREAFDISGGWVNSSLGSQSALQSEPFLKALKRMHINTAHIAETPGYTDQNGPEGLYTRYPLKYFNRLQPIDHYASDPVLPRVHAVEFLGEPQYGGGRPVPPMEVWTDFAPYQATRLPTSVTHSEERIWRYYAGLSDYPHYDAYRVSAPSPDAWYKYDRWGGKKIFWGAPLETIGEMCRSLRDLNRPMPTAYWSQGPHAGWGVYGGRRRTSPTPDELRMQAYHALASRITSLYWFNLSLASVVKFPDLIEPVTRVGREIRMLEEIYLAGDAYHYQQLQRAGHPDWDLATLAAPDAGLLFALDLDYVADGETKTFVFGEPRDVKLSFPLPPHLRAAHDLFRVDADGVHEVAYQLDGEQVQIEDRIHKVAVYVVASVGNYRDALESKRLALIAVEQALGFDPANNPEDLAKLKALLPVGD